MRVISERTLPNGLKATLFGWNGKYILKLENGFLEQTYKVSEMDVNGEAEVVSLLDSAEFLDKAKAVFELMEENLGTLFT